MKNLVICFSFVCATGMALCQDAQPDRVTVPFSDASRPKTLKASLINGSITVKGYDGKDAIGFIKLFGLPMRVHAMVNKRQARTL